MEDSPLRGVNLNLVETIEDAWNLKRWLSERRDVPLAVDTESGGLSPQRHRLRLVQVGDLHTAWAIPWERWGGVAMEVLSTYEGEFVGHNITLYDSRVFMEHTEWDIPFHRIHDTFFMAGLDDPIRPKGLKPLGARLIDRTAAQGEKLLHDAMDKQGWTWDTVPISFGPYWIYGCLDTVINAHLYKHFAPIIDDACPEAYDLERGAGRVCALMMHNGIRVDVPYVQAARTKLEAYESQMRDWLTQNHQVTSAFAGGQLARAFTRYGQEIVAFTDTGAPKFDKEMLTYYREASENPAIRELSDAVLKVRHTHKLIDSYLDNILEFRDAGDILRASINTMAARTGRMSISSPALQQLPRDDKVIRGAFIPCEGNVFISCDLDQVEMRLAAHFSRDEGLIQAFKEADEGGADFFTGVARELFQDLSIVKSDSRRQVTKNVGYAKIYGSGPDTMARTAGLPVEKALPIYEAFDARFPGLRKLANDKTEEARQESPPSIRTPLGRRLVMDKNRVFTQTLNALIQGHAAEYLKRSLVTLDAAGFGNALRLPVHDEVIVEVPAEDADEALTIIQECMTNQETYRVPITAGAKIMAERWQK